MCGGWQAAPQVTTTRFMMKKGAQQMTKVEKTTPSTRLAFSSLTRDWADIQYRMMINLYARCNGVKRKGRNNLIINISVDSKY